MNRDVIIACDFKNKADTIAFLDKFQEEKPFVKIGMELFYGEGPDIVRAIKDRGHKIFLDLKLHDIPTTVKKAMKNLARLGVDMTNVHAAGTIDMMRAAKEGLAEGAIGDPAILIAVTQLTSTNQEPLSQFSQTAGPYTASGTYLVPGGGLFIKRSELARLGLRRQRYGVIELYGTD